jgi:hypothetical protein
LTVTGTSVGGFGVVAAGAAIGCAGLEGSSKAARQK